MALSRLPCRNALATVGVLVVLGGAAAAPAEGAIAFRRVSGDVLVYQAARYEANRVTIRYDAGSNAYTIRDTGVAEIGTFGASVDGCSTDPDDRQVATCTARPGDVLAVFLDDQDDVLEQSAPRNSGVCGGAGDDVIAGGPRPDVVWGEEGNDELSGGEGIDALVGEEACSGTDGVTAPPGRDVLVGGPGNDALEAGRGPDELDGGDGDDRLFAYAGNDSLVGGDGSDFLSGDDGDDELQGNEGPDALCGGHGDDHEVGGAGDDRLGTPLTSQLFACDDAGDDVLDAGAGDDELDAGPTSGFFLEHTELPLPGPTEAGNGADQLIGGAGVDTVSYTGRLTAISGSMNGVADDGAAGEGDDVAADVERITGGAGDDALTGGPAADRLDGAGGADLLRGGPGDDTLEGGAIDAAADRISGDDGRDTLRGSAGADTLDGGADADAVSGDGGDDVIEGAAGADALEGGPGSDRLDGGAGDDRLDGVDPRSVGADGDDALAGGLGDDTLLGGPGDDTLQGGLGADRLAGGEGAADVADYRDARSPVAVTFDGIADDGRAGEHDDAGADVEGFRGGGADDTVRSGALLTGGDGEDYLDGTAGPDRLSGGAGGDTLRSRGGGSDRVACGRGLDLAVGDAADRIGSDCELVALGRASARAGRRAIVRPVTGAVGLGHAGAARTAPLLDRLSVPLPARLDAVAGAVEVVSARRGRRTKTRFSGAAFSLAQRASGRQVLSATLARAPAAACLGRPADTVVRRLRARSRALLRVHGGAGTALGRGTWIVEERCNGTRFAVVAGRVRVHDRLDRRVLVLRAGDRHLARLP